MVIQTLIKIEKICGSNTCPTVTRYGEFVAIGDKDNLCVLKMDEWDTLIEEVIRRKAKDKAG